MLRVHTVRCVTHLAQPLGQRVGFPQVQLVRSARNCCGFWDLSRSARQSVPGMQELGSSGLCTKKKRNAGPEASGQRWLVLLLPAGRGILSAPQSSLPLCDAALPVKGTMIRSLNGCSKSSSNSLLFVIGVLCIMPDFLIVVLQESFLE